MFHGLTVLLCTRIYIGVTVFVVDTGIRWDHDEFYEAPAECGFDSVYASYTPDDDSEIRESACFDGVGHGTYVAGIIGGDAYVSTDSWELLWL
jgi:subtilisin family serine protease